MKLVPTDPYKRDFLKLPDNIKRSTEKALRLFATNPFHRPLHAKKTKGEVLKGYADVFDGRFSKGYRFLFLIEGDTHVRL